MRNWTAVGGVVLVLGLGAVVVVHELGPPTAPPVQPPRVTVPASAGPCAPEEDSPLVDCVDGVLWVYVREAGEEYGHWERAETP